MAKRVHIVGIGKSGRAAAILAWKKGFEVSATDILPREKIEGIEELESLGITLDLGKHDPSFFKKADIVVISPGIPEREEFKLAEKCGAEVISEIEFASRFMKSSFIAITGTNGKSTVTTMIGSILAESGKPSWTGGNLGTALSLAVDCDVNKPEGLVALELSSFQLERIKYFKPYVSIILNITPDHFDRYKSFEDYAIAKCRIFMNQKENDHLLIPADDEVTINYSKNALAQIHFIGGENGEIYFDGEKIRIENSDGTTDKINPADCGLSNTLAIKNGMFAIKAGLLSGIPINKIIEGLRKFKPLSHRFQIVAEINGVRWINDSKATNPDAMIKSIESAEKNIILLAGGLGKGLDFSPVSKIVEGRVKSAILFGKSAEDIRKVLKAVVPIQMTGSLEEAVSIAHHQSKPGDTVLLAPGCASFDMFKNFEDRGEKFINLVKKLPE